MVRGSSDWELITGNGRESYELLLDDSNEIYFKSTVTEQEYRIGDKITIQQNISFGDGKRNFVISNWYLSSSSIERNIFCYVYVITECDGRSIHLNDIIVKK